MSTIFMRCAETCRSTAIRMSFPGEMVDSHASSVAPGRRSPSAATASGYVRLGIPMVYCQQLETARHPSIQGGIPAVSNFRGYVLVRNHYDV